MKSLARLSSMKNNLRWLKNLLQVTWLDLGLVLLLEIIAFVIHGWLGETTSVNEFLLDSCKLILWSLPICIALSLIQRKGIFMGIAGLILTPCSTLIAGILESQLREVLTTSITQPLGGNAIGLAALRGLEYAILGAALGLLAEHRQDSYLNHIIVGLITGLVFTAVIMTRNGMGFDQPLLSLFINHIDELIFPTGCALILKIVK